MPTHPHVMRLLPPLVACAVGLAACAGSSAGNASGTVAAPPGAPTVELRASKAGAVLTDANGRTLYVSDQENTRVLCAPRECPAIWRPLTVPASKSPTAPPQLSNDVTTIKRPDGQL